MGRSTIFSKWETPKHNMFVYGLIDPYTFELKYIGQTTAGLKRLKSHMYICGKKGHSPEKMEWILNLKSKNNYYDIVILEYCNNISELDEAEVFFISYFKSIGANLFNKVCGSSTHDEQSKQRISELTKRAMNTPETREKMIKSHTGIPNKFKGTKRDKEFCENVRKGMTHLIPVIDNYGNTFDSMLSAANFHGCSDGSVRNCIKNTDKILFGHLKFRRYSCQV